MVLITRVVTAHAKRNELAPHLIGEWFGVSRDVDGILPELTGRDVEVVRRQPDGTWRFIINHPTGAN